MTTTRSLYEILGISSDASQDDIATAYKKAARKCHPDFFSGDPEKAEEFVRLNKAYNILKDPVLRKKYDSDFSPIEGIADLYLSLEGKKFLESMMPSAKTADVRGPDSFEIVTFGDEEFLEIIVQNANDSLVLNVSECGKDEQWIKVPSTSYEGKNNGGRGNSFILLKRRSV